VLSWPESGLPLHRRITTELDRGLFLEEAAAYEDEAERLRSYLAGPVANLPDGVPEPNLRLRLVQILSNLFAGEYLYQAHRVQQAKGSQTAPTRILQRSEQEPGSKSQAAPSSPDPTGTREEEDLDLAIDRAGDDRGVTGPRPSLSTGPVAGPLTQHEPQQDEREGERSHPTTLHERTDQPLSGSYENLEKKQMQSRPILAYDNLEVSGTNPTPLDSADRRTESAGYLNDAADRRDFVDTHKALTSMFPVSARYRHYGNDAVSLSRMFSQCEMHAEPIARKAHYRRLVSVLFAGGAGYLY